MVLMNPATGESLLEDIVPQVRENAQDYSKKLGLSNADRERLILDSIVALREVVPKALTSIGTEVLDREALVRQITEKLVRNRALDISSRSYTTHFVENFHSDEPVFRVSDDVHTYYQPSLISETQPTKSTIDVKAAEAIKSLLQELPDRDRRILTSFYLQDKDKKVVSAELGISEKQFDTVIFRARSRFRKLLEDRGQWPIWSIG
jgi:DNA-directed RNA polymerase specialized sigma24 family protein